ncbi:pentatricopeptide repeat-containing protein At5g10690 isoform X2 [Physcomitrium patens]|uniref:CBS domain-containing protein n=1 Tax=Physcomitrium patens TaxID=3218 RepID=A0A7I4EFE6_PHYPA|nr:pentatricopeptide repeat-containing protein At5g10690-like isoform X2 [Physcomitrium patens]|eukprot:XP_024382492.1 pentatricopeptide repeat-containing protein At5g10690-like isoform X2 [Physcomitrella patens]
MATALMTSGICSWNVITGQISTSKPRHAQSLRPRASYSISTGDWEEEIPDMPSTSRIPDPPRPPKLSSPTRSPRKRRKPPKEIKPYETQLELLAQVRKRKELEIMGRDQLPGEFVSADSNENEKTFPFWRKKEFKLRELTRRIMELSARRQLDLVFEELEVAKQEHGQLNHIIMNAAVMACVACKDIDRALALYDEMVEPGGCGVDNVTYGTLLKGLGEARRLDEAFDLVELLESGRAPGRHVELTDVHLNTLVNACAHAGDALRARGVLLRYRSSVRKTGLTTLTFNLLIKGYSRSDNPLEALKLMDEMRSHNLQPQRVTFNSLILACVRGGDLRRALQLLSAMKEEAKRLNTSRLLPDVVTYTTLLRGLADAKDLQGIIDMVEEMKITPTCVLDRVAYTAIVDACIAAGSPQQGRIYMEEMQNSAKQDPQLKPRAHVFLTLMRAFAERGDLESVGSLRSRMVAEAGGHVWAEDRAEADELYIEAAVNAGKLNEAKQTLKNMVGLKKGIPLSKRAYMALTRFNEDIFSPYKLKPGVSQHDIVENLMIPFEEIRPLSVDDVIGTVAIRFFDRNSIPVIDKRGTCVGVIYAADCNQLTARVGDIMRVPPPSVTAATPVNKAITMLLQPNTTLLTVISDRTGYYSNKDDSPGAQILGFLSREEAFSAFQALPFSLSADEEEYSKASEGEAQASD